MSIFPLSLLSLSDGIFLKNSTIVHLETGLLLDYVGLYRPSDTIIHNSAIFPMTEETCVFLPPSAAAKISACNITMTRHKRSIAGIIAVGAGLLNLGISALNAIQITSLNRQMAVVENSLSSMSETVEIHDVQLARLQFNQIELAMELRSTQHALNILIPILNSHSNALNRFRTSIEQLHTRFQRSFLYSAITRIFRNELTLEFLSPDDLHNVVYDVIKQGNLTFNTQHGSIPIVEIVTRLLVRQQIDFVPSSKYSTQNPKEIGRLVITNFFAVPQQEHTSFNVYKLLAIPFFHNNETVQLSQVPRYWAINPTDNTTMEWHDSEEFGCDLQLMTSCRVTPPLRPLIKDSCLGQILGNFPLSKCYTQSVSHSAVFLRHLKDNIWVTSSFGSLHCLKIPKVDYQTNIQQTWSANKQIILPPVALVNVTSGYTILCPGFSLVGHPETSKASSLVILDSGQPTLSDISIVDVSRYLTENTTWFKANWTEERTKNIIDDIRRPTTVPISRSFSPMHQMSLNMQILNLILFGLFACLIYWAFRRCRRAIR